jgi:hypothetical protein
MDKYVEPRLRRDFGAIMSAYFDFLKGNMKALFNAFVAYNGIFVIFFLLGSYLVVTGVVQVIIAQNNWVTGDNSGYETGGLLAGSGAILLIIIFLISSLLNYGIASSYVSIYERKKVNNLDRKEVFRLAKSKFGGLILFAISAVMLYLVYFAVQLVLAFIPLLGSLIAIAIGMAFNAWLSLTIFSYVHKGEGVFTAFGEAWTLLFSGFWKAIGVNLVLGIIIQVVITALNILPAVLVGVYLYNTIDDGNGLQDDIFGQILIVVMITLFCIAFMFAQILSQSVNAFLYFNLHETKYNEYLRSRIEKLGSTV